jgi:hypothetical protein
MLAFRAGIKCQLLDNNRGPFPRIVIIGRAIVSAKWRTWGIQRGVVSALARRLHGHTILKFMRLARLKKNGVKPGTI